MSTLSARSNEGRFDADGKFRHFIPEGFDLDKYNALFGSDKDQRSPGRLSTRISPPPLSRKRGQSNVSTPASGPRAFEPRGVKRNLSDIIGPDLLQTNDSTRRDCVPRHFKRPCAILTPPASFIHEGERSASLSRSIAASTASLEPDIKKRKCRVCNKPSAKRFDPIISCPGCNRPYHESCRRPALKEGLDQELWRCLDCLNKSRRETRRKRKFPTPLSTPHADPLPRQTSTSARRVGHHIVSGLVTEVEPDIVHTDAANATVKVSLIQDSSVYDQHHKVQGWLANPAADCNANQLTTRDPHGDVTLGNWKEIRSEVPNTPLQHWAKSDLLESLPKLLPVPGSPTEAGDSARPYKTSSLTTLCSVCLTQRVFVESPGKDTKCRQCRIRASFSEDGTTEIPETPDMAPVHDSTIINSSSTLRSAVQASTPVTLPGSALSLSRLKPQQQGIKQLVLPPNEAPSPSQKAHIPVLNHTQRESFIRRTAKLALDASGGRLTASKIIKWAEGHIAQLNLADAALEKYLVEVLSASPEFHCITIDGIKGKEQVWRVAKKEIRVKNNEPAILAITKPTSEGTAPHFMPFERSSPRKTQKTKFYATYRQLDRDTLIAQSAQTSIGTMTHADKLKKIHEISRRPSRKTFFGSDHRLAHVRRTRGEDVHDESYAAWVWKPRKLIKSRLPDNDIVQRSEENGRALQELLGVPDDAILKNGKRTRRETWGIPDDVISMSDNNIIRRSEEDMRTLRKLLGVPHEAFQNNDKRTLRELLGLPDNAIPMNDGQTELAFRDGTKIKGKLPRPRQIYRVGKLFGGELTVRAS
ncbi:hypothetical protein IQ07DRAFT_602485 [Pyrenochaeta sp. DS3sAY3a]|nr:hypothetical protein IQ07DRAFT_602485 [Pyrenochaeta sp. DS3sAY3a]